MVSTHLKNISQIGNLPQAGVKIKNVWNHHLVHQPTNHQAACFSVSHLFHLRQGLEGDKDQVSWTKRKRGPLRSIWIQWYPMTDPWCLHIFMGNVGKCIIDGCFIFSPKQGEATLAMTKQKQGRAWKKNFLFNSWDCFQEISWVSNSSIAPYSGVRWQSPIQFLMKLLWLFHRDPPNGLL